MPLRREFAPPASHCVSAPEAFSMLLHWILALVSMRLRLRSALWPERKGLPGRGQGRARAPGRLCSHGYRPAPAVLTHLTETVQNRAPGAGERGGLHLQLRWPPAKALSRESTEIAHVEHGGGAEDGPIRGRIRGGTFAPQPRVLGKEPTLLPGCRPARPGGLCLPAPSATGPGDKVFSCLPRESAFPTAIIYRPSVGASAGAPSPRSLACSGRSPRSSLAAGQRGPAASAFPLPPQQGPGTKFSRVCRVNQHFRQQSFTGTHGNAGSDLAPEKRLRAELRAADEEDGRDVALQIHFTLLQAFCCENDINILRVSNPARLAHLLRAAAAPPADLHCVLVTHPYASQWKDPALSQLLCFCRESRYMDQWVPVINLPER
ncbi:PREDICTED: uncharacterized protein LOC104569448 [Tinamus guttatus]|uniref:uncharacterized protein LOC104569448 n=1 Tax=Tinamus guttatus TaxID=94827 RepID=UPI00052E9087|nr:PREDICTED: uncharacterized protein LOC104569448 [Tinamus guttatus]